MSPAPDPSTAAAEKGKILRFRHGPTFGGIISSVGLLLLILCILTIFLINILWLRILAGLLFPVGFILFIRLKYTELDIQSRRIRKIDNYLLIRKGEWIDLNHFSKLELRVEASGFHMNHRLLTRTMNTRTWELFALSEEGERLLLISLENYAEARKNLDTLGKLLGMETLDTYGLALESARERRMRREGR